MGASKTSDFSDKQNEIALMAKALGHPARVAIIEYLMKSTNCICGDIVDELPLAQPTVSQHLKELKTAGLISGNVEGNAICYCINQKAISKMLQYFTRLENQLEMKMKNCC